MSVADIHRWRNNHMNNDYKLSHLEGICSRKGIILTIDSNCGEALDSMPFRSQGDPGPDIVKLIFNQNPGEILSLETVQRRYNDESLQPAPVNLVAETLSPPFLPQSVVQWRDEKESVFYFAAFVFFHGDNYLHVGKCEISGYTDRTTWHFYGCRR